jgi:hypothetical protein
MTLCVIRLARMKVESGYISEHRFITTSPVAKKWVSKIILALYSNFSWPPLCSRRGGIAQFLGYLSWMDRPTLLSISNCISVVNNYPQRWLDLLSSLLRARLRLRADLRLSCTFRLWTAQAGSVSAAPVLIKNRSTAERHSSHRSPHKLQLATVHDLPVTTRQHTAVHYRLDTKL